VLRWEKMKRKLIYLAISLLTLPTVIVVAQGIQQLLSRAAPQPANLIIDLSQKTGPVTPVWSAFAQGGEEPPPMLGVAVDKMRELSPRYIRLDHIYDSYSVVKKTDSGFLYDFSRLDETVDHIIAMGAIPFLSLTYMPPPFTNSGSLIDPPSDWQNWRDLVKATIEHYSGKNGENLSGVYYEVWNEPELPQFGGWKVGGDKDYRLLYYHAALAAADSTNVNQFFFGGPGVGSYYPNWVSDFISYVAQNKLRIDFYSWHRYHKRPQQFVSDAQNIRRILSSTAFPQLPLILTEWGIESENTPASNTNATAAFTVASVGSFIHEITLAFNFEVKDGPPPAGGKWGLFTHEKSENPLSPKPRVKAFQTLNALKGDLVKVSGQGTFIGAIAATDGDETIALLYNYDLSGKNTQQVPVTFTGLSPSSYKLSYTYALDGTAGTYEIISTDGSTSKSFPLTANTLLMLRLTPSGELANFTPGASNRSGDQALILATMKEPLVLNASYPLDDTGRILVDIKPFWKPTDTKTFIIFEMPYQNPSGRLEKLYLSKQFTQSGNELLFGISGRTIGSTIRYPIGSWAKDSWHNLVLGWDQTSLTLSIDGQSPVKTLLTEPMQKAKIISFYPAALAIDNLRIVSKDKILIGRFFDGRIDR